MAGMHALYHMHTGNLTPNRAAPSTPPVTGTRGCEQQASPSINIPSPLAWVSGLVKFHARHPTSPARDECHSYIINCFRNF